MIIASKERFIFLLDEWDAIFYESFMSEADKKATWNS